MHLVVNQVVQLQHVHVADRYLAFETLTGTTVVQHRLTAEREVRKLQHVLDLFFVRTVEYRRRHRHAVPQIARQRMNLTVGE